MKEINRGNTIFWNVDTQFDFMDPKGHYMLMEQKK